MQTRRLGNSDMDITRLGFGAWAIGGGGWQFAWGPQDDAKSIQAIRRAVERGIGWIDTAAVYGLGHSEELVAQALEGVSRRPYVFTKCGMVWDAQGRITRSLKADSIRRECEASLRRLKVDVIDLYQIHWPVESQAECDEGWSTMAALQREGKVRWIGVSNFDVRQLERIHRMAPVTSLQPRYSLIHRDIESTTLPFCERNGIGVIAYSPMASGLLTGKMTRERVEGFPRDDWRRHSADFQEPGLSRNLELAALLREVGRRLGCSPAEVALAWVLRHSAITGAIVGARSAEQVDGFVGAGDLRLSPDTLRDIEAHLQGASQGEAHA